ncbi:uncharacterized protein LOC115741368 [Rhodamnia argentea]|uniref:Uncharacterized protein LOC115741368 n=1 Tax=Rhodamnia argentea TaxID=178133 RepID=A0ABM3HSS4_9MYRT|nr:uncharacterized protein LOC115741368 [Rhodamnia argentea]
MGFLLFTQKAREVWKEWELPLLVLLSLFLQLTLASQGSRRKSIFKNWIQVWTTYLMADSIVTLSLGILSNRLANIKETMGMIDPKSQIIAFWAPFLLLHLGGPDTVTAYALADNELWLRQLARLCVQVGIACYIYSMALSGTPLSILAAGVILVGFMKYGERTVCLHLASNGPLRRSMISRPDVGPILFRQMDQSALKRDEGYQVRIEEVTQVPAPEDLSVNSSQASGNEEKDWTLVKAYELFKIFKLLFVGLTVNLVDLVTSRRMFTGRDMDSAEAFKIVEIELGFTYDLLFTKAPLLSRAWVIIRWVISLSVLGSVLVFFSLQDKRDYATVDILITLLLIAGAILLEIYSLLLAIASDWIHHRRLQGSGTSSILSAVAILWLGPSQRWSNSVAQFSLLASSIRKRKSVFRSPRFAKLQEVVDKNFYICYEKFHCNIKELIFRRMKEMVANLEGTTDLKKEAGELLKRSNCDHVTWSVEMEFDQNVFIWHIATELLHHEDKAQVTEDITNSRMSVLVSRYMLYLLVFYPSMLPTGIGVLRYEDTLAEAQKFFDGELAMLPNEEGGTTSTSSAVVEWVQKLYKKDAHVHNRFNNCNEPHEPGESCDLCEVCWLLLQVRAELPEWKTQRAKSSVLFDACHLANQLRSVDTWDMISKVWVRLLIYAAYQCKGYEHCESLSRGGELISHVWLLMAHLSIAQLVQTSGEQCITKLVVT